MLDYAFSGVAASACSMNWSASSGATRYTRRTSGFRGSDQVGDGFPKAQLPLAHRTSQVFTSIARLNAKRAERVLREHREVIAAIRAGDGETAEQLGQEHIRRTSRSLTESPSDNPVRSADASSS